MTKLPFAINGEDFSDIVHKYGYSTDLVPLYSRVVTTMDLVDHQTLGRMRGTLVIRINPVQETRAAEFCSALRSLPATITYHCFQSGRTVEQRMRLTGSMPLALALWNGDTKWLDGLSLTFEQL